VRQRFAASSAREVRSVQVSEQIGDAYALLTANQRAFNVAQLVRPVGKEISKSSGL
jgi:hypothetical protein